MTPFYTIIVLLVYLLLGAPKIVLGFNPVVVAFVVAILLDLYEHRGLLKR